jgi:uncharacterized protein (TIGR04255 family)
MFSEEWTRFQDFLRENQIASPEVLQCEVTYVNHIEKGSGWSSLAELSEVVAIVAPNRTTGFLPPPEVFLLDTRYVIPEEVGRLRVLIQPAIRNTDRKEVLQLTLTARGAPQDSSMEAVLTWLDLGRKWVVNGFVDLTTDKMQQLWKRKEVS